VFLHDHLLRRLSGVDPVDPLWHDHISLDSVRSPGWLTVNAVLKPLRAPETWHWLGNYTYRAKHWIARFD